MTHQSDIEIALNATLPPQFHPQIPVLAQVLAGVAEGIITEEEAAEQLADPAFLPLLKALSGRQFSPGSISGDIMFGNISQGEGIVIGHGSSVTTIHLHLSPATADLTLNPRHPWYMPRRPMVIILLTAICIVVLVVITTLQPAWLLPPPQMSGDIRVLIPTLNAGPPPPDLPVGVRKQYTTALATNVRTTIGNTLANDTTLSFAVWGPAESAVRRTGHDSLTDLAQHTNANMVVFGTMGEDSRRGTLSLGLFVVDTSSPEMAELLGSHYVGEPIAYQPPFHNISAQSVASRSVQQRIETVTALILGIAAMEQPGPNASVRAQQFFDRALETIRDEGFARSEAHVSCPQGFDPPPSTNAPSNPRAEATVYVLKGNAAFRAHEYRVARAFYNEALARSCDYARAHLGMATVLVRQAIGESPPESALATDIEAQHIYRTTLEAAAQYFAWAQQAIWRPEQALFHERIAYGLAELSLGRARLPDSDQTGLLSEAIASYTDVIRAFETAMPGQQHQTVLRRLAASSYANRALARISLGQIDAEVIDDYQHAIQLDVDHERRAFWMGRLAEVYMELGACTDAIAMVEHAISEDGDSPRIHQLQEIKDMITEGCSQAGVQILERMNTTGIASHQWVQLSTGEREYSRSRT